jgi:hypothetical protein
MEWVDVRVEQLIWKGKKPSRSEGFLSVLVTEADRIALATGGRASPCARVYMSSMLPT